ncbi:MAG: CPBP family intramembrane metalloprotease [Oscillospiraceae bacterium]|nr:CPBP family intramembrane metalloprotease [Oscillospiraceae bacterium]
MKKHFVIAGKAVGFFILWGLAIAVLAIPSVEKPAFLNGNAAYLRLWWEAVPLFGILLATGIFVWAVEKNKIKVPLFKSPVKNVTAGLALGCVWLGVTVLFLYITGVFAFGGKNSVDNLPVWFAAVFLNVVMQNYLVRGYLFSLLRAKYNTAAAVIITTVLFTAMHGGAFEAGVVAVLNVVTMSIFVSLLLIYTKSLLAPITAHFVWNGAGRLVFGVVSMADDYPNIWNGSLSGNALISGGSFRLEGSIAVLAMNLLLIAFMAFQLKKRSKR